MLSHIERAEATILYLRLIRSVLKAYVIEDTSVQDRIFHGVFVVHFIRIWRQWIYNKKISVDHFITLNSWEGLELNLILLLRLARDNKAENIYFFNSQINEAFFRLLRSYTGMESMIVNCSMKGFISRVHRIQLEEIIMKGLEEQFKFPKLLSREKHRPKSKENLTRNQIEGIIENALTFASNQAKEIGMDVPVLQLKSFLKSVKMDCLDDQNPDEFDPEEDLLGSSGDNFNEKLLNEMSIDESSVCRTTKEVVPLKVFSLQNMILTDVATGKYLKKRKSSFKESIMNHCFLQMKFSQML